jgi:hypothetical protein
MKITELFDPKEAVEIKWGRSRRHATAMVDPKTRLEIDFAGNGDPISIEFNVNDQFDITGTGGGNVSAIFATVIEAVKQFVQNNPEFSSIYFTAGEKSRARMYDTLVKRVARQLGWHVVPYDDMVADEKYQTALSYGDFTFAVEKGAAPEHRQAAQKPQHGEFMRIYYVVSFENPDLPAIRIKAKNGDDAEQWVIKNIPEYKNEDPFGVFANKQFPTTRKIVDMGQVPDPAKAPAEHPLAAALRNKLGS